MKTAKKLLVLLLAVVMVASLLVACNNDKPVETKPQETQGGNKPAETKPAETEPAEPVKLTFMYGQADVIPEDSIAGQFFKQVEEHCGVEIEWILPPSSAYQDQLQLTLLEEERPDAIIFPTAWTDNVSYIDAVKAGMFWDITDMLPNYENIMKHTAAVSWEALDILDDGRIWAVPRSTVMRADGWHVNEAWLKAIGSDYVEGEVITIDELYDILYKFTYNDPDGNGVNDTYGVMAYAQSDGLIWGHGLQHIFGISGNEWQEVDGEPVMLRFSKEHDNYKKYLAFMNKLWSEGIIDPDAYALDLTGAAGRWALNITGLWCQYAGNMQVTPKDTNPATYVYLPGVVEKEGDTFGYGDWGTGVYWYWSISNTCEHPEKVLEVFDYILSDEMWPSLNAKSLIGVGFDIDADGNYDFSKTNALKAEGKGNEQTKPIGDIVRRCGEPEFFIDKSLPKELRDRLSAGIGYALEYYKAPVDDGFVPETASDPVFIEYMAFVAQAEAKIITGEEPIEYWDEVLDGRYAAGGDKYCEEVLAYINSK